MGVMEGSQSETGSQAGYTITFPLLARKRAHSKGKASGLKRKARDISPIAAVG